MAVDACFADPPVLIHAARECRFCGAPLVQSFVDLGMSPSANNYLGESDLRRLEPFYPLHAYVCDSCFLVQLEAFQTPQQLFAHYSYFSSYSQTWLDHAETYAAAAIERFGIDATKQVVEIASNDGYLLQFFRRRGIPVFGIEPAANVARAAEQRGVPTLVRFFDANTARALVVMGKQADLLIGNNVLAHVPDLNGFVSGLKVALKASGVLTMEFPHLLRLMELNQFDTIYHEHFSYFSFLTAEKVFATHGLTVFDVDELSTHGGSLRLYGCHANARRPVSKRVGELRERERAAGIERLDTYCGFAERVRTIKRELLEFLFRAKAEGKAIVAYGAPAKGNTLLNYCGVRTDFLDYTVDLNPHKQGLYLPGTHIPIHDPSRIAVTKPDYVLILPWNLREEIMAQMAHVRDWGGRFVVPIPEVTVYE